MTGFYKSIKEHKMLTPMQMRFVEEYIKDPSNATSAAKRAGYAIASATEASSRLMNDPRVQEMIEKATQRAVKALGITKERVLQELWLIATANPADAITYDENGEPNIDLRSISQDKAVVTEVAVSTITGKRGGKQKNVTIKTPKQTDKVAALIQIGKHLGMFKEQVEVKGKIGLDALIAGSYDDDDSSANSIEDQSNIIDSTAVELPLREEDLLESTD